MFSNSFRVILKKPDVGSEQCDQIAQIFVAYFYIYNNEQLIKWAFFNNNNLIKNNHIFQLSYINQKENM